MRGRGGTALAVAWVILAAGLFLAPALTRGAILGPQDILAQYGLDHVAGVQVHNGILSDQIDEMIPWSALSWQAVHQGHLPLWNPYSGVGMPLLSNFQSASFSLPTLISYLGPERYLFTVEIAVTLIIAGTGVLWMCRRLALGNLAASFAATSFMLSGAFSGWLGWPMSGTMAWLGWVVGATVLLIRDRRAVHAAGLAVALAFAIYAGHPESLAMLVLFVVVVAAFCLTEVGRRAKGSDVVRSGRALCLSCLAGLGLAAPLLLPGYQIIERSARKEVVAVQPARVALNLAFASYYGQPVKGSLYLGPINYYETASYVGPIVLVLAVVGVAAWRRHPVVQGLATASALFVLLVYVSPVGRPVEHIPVLKNIGWSRGVIALDFGLAVLAGYGLQALVSRPRSRAVAKSMLAATAILMFVILGLGLTNIYRKLGNQEATIRAHSFIWPVIETTVLLLVAGVLLLSSRQHEPTHRGRLHRSSNIALISAGVLFSVNAAFLVTASSNLESSGNVFFPTTAGVTALKAEVGSARVGVASCPTILSVSNLGILPEANDVYGVSELSLYDPTVPRSYFTTYFHEIGEPLPSSFTSLGWCPSLGTAQVARHFGVGYVLADSGGTAPRGAVLVKSIGGEALYRVPGGGVLTIEPAQAPSDSATATVASFAQPDPATMRAHLSVSTPSTLYIHVTDFPGWRATIDGRALPLRKWGGTMLAASIPGGDHVLTLRYEPKTFREGLAAAVVTGSALITALVFGYVRNDRRRRRGCRIGSEDTTTSAGQSDW